MLEPLKAPVVFDGIETTDVASPATLIWNGTGVASIFVQSWYGGSLMGVVFGPSASMPLASSANVFPVPFEGIVWKIGPSTRYISVFPLAGGYGAVGYYFEGQTDVTT